LGQCDFLDHEENTCSAPSEHTGDEVPFPIPRSGKRLTLVACIGIDGSFLKPSIVIHRKIIDADAALTGLTNEKLAIYSQPKGLIDQSIFWAWFDDVFIPEICQLCARYQSTRGIVLLMDNCTTHAFPRFKSLCTQHGITICLLQPHSSNQGQPLDPLTFGITKQFLARVNRMETVNIESLHTAHAVSTFMSAASAINVIATFQSVGINLAIADEKLICWLTPRSTRCLMASVDFEGNPKGETVSVGEATETQRHLERIVTDTEELEEELKQIRIKFTIIDF
jgi:hypothetical protein